MAINLDSYLRISVNALSGQEKRASIIANNLANADTPNFKAQDLDFDEYLKASMNGNLNEIQTTSPGHLSQSGANLKNGTILKYRTPNNISLDGNTVDKELETTEFTKATLNYRASLTFLTGTIKTLISAFKGA